MVAVAFACAAAIIFLNHNGDTVVSTTFGSGRAATQIFLPVKPVKEERVLRRSTKDGGAVDDVLMRDGTTKTIVYDKLMTLRQVTAFYKAPTGQQHGPVMYTKSHDETGHLSAERHLRLDGTLEMDGSYDRVAETYLRHTYFASPVTNTATHPVTDPVTNTDQYFDKWFHPTRVVEYRADGSRSQDHTWGDGSDESFDNYGLDGRALVSTVKTGRGRYYQALYYENGVDIKVEALNTYEGSTFQWYRPDHSLIGKLTYTQSHSDVYVLADQTGHLLVRQSWYRDFSGQSVNGVYPMRLDHLERYNAQGNIDRRYDYTDATLTEVTDYLGDDALGARRVWSIGMDGYPLSVKTYDADDKDDGGKPVSVADHVDFTPDAKLKVLPLFQLPKLPDNLNLYGLQQRMFRDH